MVSAETETFILQIIDYNQEFVTKIIVLVLLFSYSLYMSWYSKKLAPDEINPSDLPLKDMIIALFMKIFSIPVLIFFPLMVIMMLFRGYALGSLLNLILSFYILATISIFIYVFLFGWQKLLELFNIYSFSGKQKMRMKSNLRRSFRR